MVASLRSVILASVVTTSLVAVGCADDDSGPETPAETSPAAASQTVSPTAAKTAVPATDQRLQEMLNEPGLASFLSDLSDAVEANDVQFLIDHTHFAGYECQSRSGFPAEPEECEGNPGLKLSAISSGAWQSEGGYWSETTYEFEIRDRLKGADADGATMYAIGQMTLGDDQSPDAADVVIAGLGGLRDMAPFEGMAMSLAIAEQDGTWMITEFDSANTKLVPDFYDWWIGWEEFAGAAGLRG